MNIYCTKHELQINNTPIHFPIQFEQIIAALGEPNRVVNNEKYTFEKTYVWDALGIKVMESVGAISNIMLHYRHSDGLKVAPTQLFDGVLHLDGNAFVLPNHPVEGAFLKGFWTVSRLQRPEDKQPFGVSIWHNKFFEIPADKYNIPKLNEEIIEFTDFNFKLCIIQILMYEKELLQPKFDIYEFIKWYKQRTIDTEEERFEPIPEVMQYFKQLPIPKRFAKEITEIYQDGGNEIYLNTCLECEGYEDYWDIESTEDTKHFPHLKSAVLCYAKPHILDELKAKGIESRWI
ncbi:DUF6892 domain-containing protein [Paenimyroides aestuarii]|uniref:Uncharacterized protein n=1 Tax=Paenimyroides aestuarii TaxID=2968490 RepID=A0ABY5NUW2_9FLAO|nr:hypothetical protein [Paenimyroides aestuarii]UUV22381.1 hypothetical protein NPX36_04900 [Paenimyroides aestuarii]